MTRNIKVLVYGEWPNQSNNILPFFTASFPEKEIFDAKEKSFNNPFRFLFVGNLVRGKNPLKAIKMVQELQTLMGLNQESWQLHLNIYGDGPERAMLEYYCEKHNLKRLVRFKGNRTLEELKMAYEDAHFVILPSQSEGWPKAVAEGMFFGCIPIATAVSCVPWMLNYGSRGILIPDLGKREEEREKGERVESGKWKEESHEVLDETVKKIVKIIKDPVEMRRISRQAQEWSQQYTVEKFEEAIKKVLPPQAPKGEQQKIV
ncbi:glycosyltransferase family 4 protein [Antarcticibacterium sp. 1MA-6-2]|uniref:glycosyltransferase family 4 protein n=1 Tax=Antarcticibacterium sp. 1MA-6-2 TaxID=2908210 RepID=UPI001F1CA7B7|nr:glycosyltransferase family 4 protein [Antarcticibacterium sp. 1MA-6-2]UJH92493.1 glycosyltransferase family 4 protein [Antarcticibacterium sp. 1MA-6-2]